jgi:hypothetical protein
MNDLGTWVEPDALNLFSVELDAFGQKNTSMRFDGEATHARDAVMNNCVQLVGTTSARS